MDNYIPDPTDKDGFEGAYMGVENPPDLRRYDYWAAKAWIEASGIVKKPGEFWTEQELEPFLRK